MSRVPDEIDDRDTSVLACTGVSAFNALQKSGPRPGEVVAVLGIGGVGHMSIQMAARMGFVTVAVSRGRDKEDLDRRLGADHFVDGSAQDLDEELRRLGGAQLIVSTTTEAAAVSGAIEGLKRRGEMVMIGIPQENLSLNALQLITNTRSITGLISGTPLDREQAFGFAVAEDIRPMF
ncbi:zinc-binding dehydrogenase [Streptomyces sp. NBC_01497]|nr:zinc-binding dehydrogenase [Streptomyces sp. NBC_01497]